jgi:hypothetical protein
MAELDIRLDVDPLGAQTSDAVDVFQREVGLDVERADLDQARQFVEVTELGVVEPQGPGDGAHVELAEPAEPAVIQHEVRHLLRQREPIDAIQIRAS